MENLSIFKLDDIAKNQIKFKEYTKSIDYSLSQFQQNLITTILLHNKNFEEHPVKYSYLTKLLSSHPSTVQRNINSLVKIRILNKRYSSWINTFGKKVCNIMYLKINDPAQLISEKEPLTESIND